jgi:hypothetical protein
VFCGNASLICQSAPKEIHDDERDGTPKSERSRHFWRVTGKQTLQYSSDRSEVSIATLHLASSQYEVLSHAMVSRTPRQWSCSNVTVCRTERSRCKRRWKNKGCSVNGQTTSLTTIFNNKIVYANPCELRACA